MRTRISARNFLALTLTATLALTAMAAVSARQERSLALASSKLTIDGSSNLHEWSATTTDVRITQSKLGVSLSDANFLEAIVKPGAFEAFEIAVPVATLKSGKDTLDKNMYKALKSPEVANVTFRATKLQAGATAGTLRLTGLLKIATVQKEVTFDVTAQLAGALLTIKGTVPILMTDYGIEPPKAMLGMLKTDPKVSVTFVTVLTVPPAANF